MAANFPPPRFLYRYRPLSDFSLSEIANNTVYLCSLDRLNDPLEGTFDIENSDLEQFRNILISKALADGEEEFAAIITLLALDELTTIHADAEAIGATFVNARAEWGVACFTQRLNNKKMWERYADACRGYGDRV